jgi:hypothetical protein
MDNNITQNFVDHFLEDPDGNFKNGFEPGKTYTVEIESKHDPFKINMVSLEAKTGMTLKSVIYDEPLIKFVFIYMME